MGVWEELSQTHLQVLMRFNPILFTQFQENGRRRRSKTKRVEVVETESGVACSFRRNRSTSPCSGSAC